MTRKATNKTTRKTTRQTTSRTTRKPSTARKVSRSGTPGPVSDPVSDKKAPHLVVLALAGTGKTTTAVGGVRKMFGLEPGVVPSPEQEAIWEAMAQERPQSVLAIAYNKSIATTLQERMPPGVESGTAHSFGFRQLRKMFPRVKVEKWKTRNILDSLFASGTDGVDRRFVGKDCSEIKRMVPGYIEAVEDLVSLSKQTYFDPYIPDDSQIAELVDRFGIDTNGEEHSIFPLVRVVLEWSLDVSGRSRWQVDFDDMVWVPLARKIDIDRYDLVMVDEAQDLNPVRQQLVLRAANRIMLIGDPNQAIYGFTGADTRSMETMRGFLEGTSRGVVTLPLTETRRCGKKIVEECRKIVPQFRAHEGNPEGQIGTATREEMIREAGENQNGEQEHMILCRTNAPLVPVAFSFLKSGKRVRIQGREIGRSLLRLVEKSKAGTIPELVAWAEEYRSREVAKINSRKNPSQMAIQELHDKVECLIALADGVSTIKEYQDKVSELFSDEGKGREILLSTVHRAKGLEAHTVWILHPELMPHPMARADWEKGQEMNIKYVALSRATHRMIYVRTPQVREEE